MVGGCSLHPNAPMNEAFMETLKSCEVYDYTKKWNDEKQRLEWTWDWKDIAPLNTGR